MRSADLVTGSESALPRFAVAGVQIFPCFIHGADDQIERNFACPGKDVGKIRTVERTQCGDGIAFDAGDLNIPADRIARQPELMLKSDLRRILRRLQRCAEDAARRSGRHGHRWGV